MQCSCCVTGTRNHPDTLDGLSECTRSLSSRPCVSLICIVLCSLHFAVFLTPPLSFSSCLSTCPLTFLFPLSSPSSTIVSGYLCGWCLAWTDVDTGQISALQCIFSLPHLILVLLFMFSHFLGFFGVLVATCCALCFHQFLRQGALRAQSVLTVFDNVRALGFGPLCTGIHL